MKKNTAALAMAFVAMLAMGCSKSKSSKTAAASMASGLNLVSSSYGLAPGAQATITATGGTGIYSTYNTSVGTLQVVSNGTYMFTAPATLTGVTAATITVTDSSGLVGSINIAITGASAHVLSMYSTASPIPVGGNVTLSVMGGTGPYNWQITAGGGALSPMTGQSVTYTAPASAGSVTVLVSDSAGNSLYATIPIMGASQATCSGYFAINAYGKTGTLYLAPGAGGQVTGTLKYDGKSTANLNGVCTASGITFTLTDGTVYSGGFYYTTFDPNIASMVGTFGSSNHTWVAVPQH